MLTASRRSSPRMRLARGLSLVELMVGVAVGLFVVAGAATVAATQMFDSRRLVLEAQIQQDLRATADIMTRELRRAGQWDAAASAVWVPGSAAAANPYDTLTLPSSSEVAIARQNNTVLGFRRQGSTPGVIQLRDGGGGWQALTDATTLDVTDFNVQLAPVANLPLSCTALCTDGTQACWPAVEVRELRLQITGRSTTDPNVVRSIQSSVRLRNDRIVNNNAGGPLCP